MKTLFSFILSLFIAGGGILFAMNAPQDDPRCFDEQHKGYKHTGTPPLPFNPDATMPTGTTYLGEYGDDFNFICEQTSPSNCHWVYIPETELTEAEWIPCSGQLVNLRQVE